MNLEDGNETCDLQQLMHALGQAQELQIPSLFAHRGQARHQRPKADTVNVGDLPEVEDQTPGAGIDQLFDLTAKSLGLAPQGNTSRMSSTIIPPISFSTI